MFKQFILCFVFIGGAYGSSHQAPPQNSFATFFSANTRKIIIGYLNKLDILASMHAQNNYQPGISYSPDGQYLYITAGNSNFEIRKYEVDQKYKHIHSAQNDGQIIISLAYSPDGKYLTAGTINGSLIIRNMFNNKPVLSFNSLKKPIKQIIYSPDGKFLAASCSSLSETNFFSAITLWSRPDHKFVTTIIDSDAAIQSIAFSPQRDELLACTDNSIQIWHPAKFNWNNITNLNEQKCEYQSFHGAAVYSPDGTYIARSSTSAAIQIWDRKLGTLSHTITPEKSILIHALAYSPQAHYLAAGCQNNRALIYSVPDYTLRHTIYTDAPVYHIKFSPTAHHVLLVAGRYTDIFALPHSALAPAQINQEASQAEPQKSVAQTSTFCTLL
jgi:WD40 repeat protein